MLDGSFLTTPFTTDLGVASASPFTPEAGPLDPRIHHSLGTRGIPFVDWGLHAGADWIADPSAGGPYSPREYVQTNLEFPSSFLPSGRPRGATNENQALLRYADVLLMMAECEIEAGTLEQARSYVNQVRARAANPDELGQGPGRIQRGQLRDRPLQHTVDRRRRRTHRGALRAPHRARGRRSPLL